MPDLTWEYLGSRTVRKQIDEVRARPNPDTGAYGSVYRYDTEKPQITASISAKNVPKSDADSAMALVAAQNSLQTYTLADGSTVTGLPFSYSDRLNEGTGLFEVTIELIRTDI